MEMVLGNRKIGPEHPPIVVAEIGINHGGCLNVAKNMVLVAAQAGAECIKHQTHFVEDEMTEEAKSIYPPNADMSIWEVMEQCSLTADEEVQLKRYANELNLIYISTPFSRKAANFLHEIDIPAFKIGSGEVDNLPLIKHIAGFGRPVILSTGMQKVEDVRPAVEILRSAAVPFALLECSNLYPAPPEIISLKGINELGAEFPDAIVGFSDHSIGPYMSIAAVALGARIIERHFTDTRYRVGPDISCSMDPAELRLLVDRTKEIHTALKTQKMRSVKEEAVYGFARGSIVADADLETGTIISESNIWARRPGSGEIPASDYFKLIGRRTKKPIKYNQQLCWEDLD